MDSNTSTPTTTIHIDGSRGEGGGQIIRIAVSLATILKKKIRIFKIRANRPNPGLASQHLESILALQKLATLRTDRELRRGTVEFELDGTLSTLDRIIDTKVDLVTAGSVTLCLQVLLPYLIQLRTTSKLRIIGGTHVLKSPSFDYLERVFKPMVSKIGVRIELDLVKPGYYPRGGGVVNIEVMPSVLGAFKLEERGDLLQESAILNLPRKLKHLNGELIQMMSIKKSVETRSTPFASVEYFYTYENTQVGFSATVESRHPTRDELKHCIQKVEEECGKFKDSKAAVDEWMQDQFLIYMALGRLQGVESSFTTGVMTEHSRSAMGVIQLLTGVEFDVCEGNSFNRVAM